MDSPPIVFDVLQTVWWLAPAAIIIGFTRSRWFKGYFGELLVRLSGRLLLPREVYHPIHNVTLRTPGGTTQIDHIFVSCYGIFVVETKNMAGWIFGSENQAQWTQKIYRNTYRIQNPLRQNFKHVKALEAALEVPTGTIHSVVVFVGGSTFKTKMPANVTYTGGYIAYIKSFKQSVLSEEQVHEALAQIESGRLEPSWATDREHVRSLKTRSDPDAIRHCPKCGSTMILRTTKRGVQAGRRFWGCSGYPKCRLVQSVT